MSPIEVTPFFGHKWYANRKGNEKLSGSRNKERLVVNYLQIRNKKGRGDGRQNDIRKGVTLKGDTSIGDTFSY